MHGREPRRRRRRISTQVLGMGIFYSIKKRNVTLKIKRRVIQEKKKKKRNKSENRWNIEKEFGVVIGMQSKDVSFSCPTTIDHIRTRGGKGRHRHHEFICLPACIHLLSLLCPIKGIFRCLKWSINELNRVWVIVTYLINPMPLCLYLSCQFNSIAVQLQFRSNCTMQ